MSDTTKTKQRYQLSADDLKLAQFMESYSGSRMFLESFQSIRAAGYENLQLFFRVIAPKYGFDPSTAEFAGSPSEPSWDVLAVPVDAEPNSI